MKLNFFIILEKDLSISFGSAMFLSKKKTKHILIKFVNNCRGSGTESDIFFQPSYE